MKFTLFTQAALAIPFITGAFAIPTPDGKSSSLKNFRYQQDWVESGLDRYRMHLITSSRSDRHLDVYCEDFKKLVGLAINPQCFWGDAFYADASAARGPAGQKVIQDRHNKACDDFEKITGCRTIREF
ncbi:Ff.00g006300.m01.CDS01 [Fusarium sp. VM40]|nr:Ff.00g006300.m01.CDS01 [Fusarium sp. VM40]